MSASVSQRPPAWPSPDFQWVEDRFWVWIHYGATKLGRGEYFEVIELLSYLRTTVLGPYLAMQHGALPRGVRFVEQLPPLDVAHLRETVATPDADACARALQAASKLYEHLRDRLAPEDLVRRESARTASLAYLASVRTQRADLHNSGQSG